MTFRTKLLVVITVLAAILRFWGLGQNPTSLNWDEIAIGYNAYSILKTGKDEFGTFLPTTFRSFDDYKSPVYVYLTIPAIAVFGKTEFAIRFASAALGTLTIPIIYLLTSQLLKKQNNHPATQNIGIIAAFLLAITPWHVHFSRVAFEANIALFFTCLATVLLFKWFTNSSTRYILLTTYLYALAIHTYANMRLFIPLLLTGLFIIRLPPLLQRWKQLTLAALLGILLISPLLFQMLQGTGLARYQATSIINRPYIYDRNNERFTAEVIANQTILGKVLYNPRWAVLTAFQESYFAHFTYDFLFTQKIPDRSHIPGVGLLYTWMLPLIVFGIITLIQKRDIFSSYPTIYWALIAPIPAGLTWDTPHAIRTEILLPPLIILSALGLWGILKYLQQLDIKNYKIQTTKYKLTNWLFPKAVFIAILASISLSAIRMIHNYHYLMPIEFAEVWLYGRKEMVTQVQHMQHEFKEVQVSLSLDWAYLWFLWYGNIDPAEYLAAGGTKSGAFDFQGNHIGNIKFQNFNYTQDSFNNSGILFVGTPTDFPKEFVPGQAIENAAGQKVIYLIRS